MKERIKSVPMQFTRKIPLIQHICPVCGTHFEGAKIAVYCSRQCKNRKNWQEHGQKYNASRIKPKENN